MVQRTWHEDEPAWLLARCVGRLTEQPFLQDVGGGHSNIEIWCGGQGVCFSTTTRAALAVGYHYGQAFVLARLPNNRWSAPLYLTIGKVALGISYGEVSCIPGLFLVGSWAVLCSVGIAGCET